jgi:hypothetical protein
MNCGARTCKQINLHHDLVTVFCRKEDDKLTTLIEVDKRGEVLRRKVRSDQTNNPSSRRDGLAVRFWCELRPMITELTLRQHKGSIYLGLRIVGERLTDDEFDSYLPTLQPRDVSRASWCNLTQRKSTGPSRQ